MHDLVSKVLTGTVQMWTPLFNSTYNQIKSNTWLDLGDAHCVVLAVLLSQPPLWWISQVIFSSPSVVTPAPHTSLALCLPALEKPAGWASKRRRTSAAAASGAVWPSDSASLCPGSTSWSSRGSWLCWTRSWTSSAWLSGSTWSAPAPRLDACSQWLYLLCHLKSF